MHHRPSSSSTAAAESSLPLSPADGFLCVKDGVDGMIKYVANEPSVGLYFVQQHARASMPILLDVKGKLVEKTNEVTLHTEDMEDSICAVRLIQNPIWGFQSGKSSGTLDELGATNGNSSRNYLSSMFNTAKQKASSLRWAQPDFTTKDDSSENSASSAAPETSQAGGQGASTPDAERDDIPVSSRLLDGTAATNKSLPATDISETVETYNKFKEEQELKLQEWLKEAEKAEDNRD
ncbi:unnamed protein product [Urochloa decumbens]|uniref:Uncharacterized protein n=1 Tax=Urochloa decumbens TaxID=240449 RepID=A0ABC9BVH5_9POAL